MGRMGVLQGGGGVGGGGGDGAILDGVSAGIKATVFDYSNSNPLAVRLTDTSGDYVGAGGGTQYTEDAVAAGNPTGNALIGRRRDTLSGTEVSADGDVIALNATAKGELYVKHVDAVDTELTTADLDTGGGTDTRAVVGLVRAESGGGVLVGSANPLPISGTVTVTDGSGPVTVDGTVGISGTVTVDTELATAVALADNLANPTAGLAGAMAMVWDGTQWKRLLHDANGIDVDVTRVSGSVTVDSELPAAAALGDSMGSPSVPNVGALLALFDGTNYVRGRGDATNGLDVDVTRMPAAARTTDAIAAALQTDAIMNGATALTPKWAFANISASTTDGSVVAAVTSKKIRPLAVAIMAGATATNVTLNTKPAGAGTAKTCLFACPANGGLVLQFNPSGWFETTSGEGLTMTTGSGSTVGILVLYVEV